MRAGSIGGQCLQLGSGQADIGALPHNTAKGRALFAAYHDPASGRKRGAFRGFVKAGLNLAVLTESYAEYLFHKIY